MSWVALKQPRSAPPTWLDDSTRRSCALQPATAYKARPRKMTRSGGCAPARACSSVQSICRCTAHAVHDYAHRNPCSLLCACEERIGGAPRHDRQDQRVARDACEAIRP